MLETFLIGGVVLIVLEMVLPGGVVAPLGLAGLVVAALVWLGVADGWLAALTVWFVLSLVLVMVGRMVFQRFMPGEEERGSTDEDAELFDQVVDVVETIEKGREGRVSLRESSWRAICYETTLQAGAKARIFYRDGLRLVVTPVTDDPLNSAGPDGPAT